MSDMDIVERLRNWSGQVAPVSSTEMYAMTQEAADEIERLRADPTKSVALNRIIEGMKTEKSGTSGYNRTYHRHNRS